MKKLGFKSPKATGAVRKFEVPWERSKPNAIRMSKITNSMQGHHDRFKFRRTSSSSIEQCVSSSNKPSKIMSKEYSFVDRTERKAETLQTRQQEAFCASYSHLSKRKSVEQRPNEHKSQSHRLSNELAQILQLIRQEKRSITAKINRTNAKAEKYKQLYLQMVNDKLTQKQSDEKKKEMQRQKEKEKLREKQKLSDESNEMYSKFHVILQQMNINIQKVLPNQIHNELSKQQEKQHKSISNPQIIQVQKLLIKKLVECLQQQRHKLSTAVGN